MAHAARKRVLDNQSILLLFVYSLYNFAHLLSGTFLPIYLWKASQSYTTIGYFTLSQYIVSGIVFWLAGKWVKERNKMNCLRAGSLLSGSFYCMILFLGENASAYPFLLGILSGVGLGFFWLSFNIVYFEITEPDTRDVFNGWQGLLTAFSGIVAPWSSGMIITMFKQVSGYTVIFTISLILFATAAILSFWLHKREFKGLRYDWKYGLKQLQSRDSIWRKVFLSLAAQGVREGLFMFLIGLTVYMATTNESKVGTYSLIVSIVSLCSYFVVGKWITPAKRSTVMLVGTIMLSVVIVPLFFGISFTSLLLFGIGTSLFIPWYMIPMMSRVFDVIGMNEESVERREELIILREIGLTVGRLIGLAPFLIVIQWELTEQMTAWLLFGVGIFPVFGWMVLKPVLKINAIENTGSRGAK